MSLLTRDVSGFSTPPHFSPFITFTPKSATQELNSEMSLLSREQVVKSWYAKNPAISFLDLLYALEQHKSISTEYGLNVSIEQHWRFGDPHKKTAEPDRHDYEIAMVNGSETPPGPDWHKLYRWLVSQSSAFLPYHTVYLVTDNRDLQSDKVKSVHGLSHWPMAESMHGFDLVRLQITIVRHQIHGVVRQESRALTNQPSVQLVPVRSRWSFTPVYHCNLVVMSIRFSCLLMGVSKSPVLFNRYIQPVLSRNALVLFKCVKQIQEANCRVFCVPGLHNLFPGKQRHLTVQFLCS